MWGVTATSHVIDPCDRCTQRSHCEVPEAISRIRHPWNVPDVDFGRNFMETVRAEVKNEGLHVVLRCERFKEDRDAPRPDRR